MSENKEHAMPLAIVLFLIFLVLKLTNNIDWSWWWITAPLWISISVEIIVGIIYFFKLPRL